MDIRKAILQAADHIEARPHLFQFNAAYVPLQLRRNRSEACALGWIGHFLNEQRRWYQSPLRDYSRAAEIMLVTPIQFYERMTLLEGTSFHNLWSRWSRWERAQWLRDARICAQALRRYADKYHPLHKRATRTGIPESIRNIFRRRETEAV